jgi:hypothetical protein
MSFGYDSHDEAVLQSRLLHLQEVQARAVAGSTVAGLAAHYLVKRAGLRWGRLALPLLAVGTTMYGWQAQARHDYQEVAQAVNRKYTEKLNRAMFFQ